MRPITQSIMIAALAIAIYNREAHVDITPPKMGDLYAFCDTEWKTKCNGLVLMTKEACDDTLEFYTVNDPRFSCEKVDQKTLDAYVAKLNPDVRAKLFEYWKESEEK